MTYVQKAGTSWSQTYAQCVLAAPEAFDADRIRNLIGGQWVRAGVPGEHQNPVDGEQIEGPPRINHDEAVAAVDGAVREHVAWSKVGLEQRKEQVARTAPGLGDR